MTPVTPPSAATRLLECALGRGDAADEIMGDLHEEFVRHVGRRGRVVASAWYVAEALRLSGRAIFERHIARRTRGIPHLPEPRGDALMHSIATDVIHAARGLRKRPWLSATLVVSLGLALGANGAIFETIDALVLRPFTLPNIDRAVIIAETAQDEFGPRETVSPANYLDWKQTAKTVDRTAAFEWWDVNLASEHEAERVQGFFVTSEFFAILGVQPALGRTFTAAEEVRGRHRRAIISDGLWRRRFGADAGILGRTMLLDAEPFEVIGVMPPGFEFPDGASIWAPLSFDTAGAARRDLRYLTVVATLRPGVTLEDANAEMAVIAGRLEQQYPEVNRGRGARVLTIMQGMRDIGLATILSLWQASAAFVLLIACANIASLLLARGAERQRELALRIALGASRGRLVRALLIESLTVAMVSVPVAIGVAWIGITLIRVNLPARLVRFVSGWESLDVDLRLIAFTAALAAVASVIVGIIPALQASRPALGETLKEGGRTSTAGAGRQRLRRALVTGEIALVLPLLVASGMAWLGTQRFVHGPQGYDPERLLTMKAVLPDAKYAQPDARRHFVEDVLARLSTLPGVQMVAVANSLPSSSSNATRPLEIEGRPWRDPANPPRVDYRTVTPEYFATMRIPLRRGRGVAPTDRAGAQPVVIVSESLAREFFGNEDPIGRRLRFGSTGDWQTIVGVSGDIIQDWFNGRHSPTVYRPYAQAPSQTLGFIVRADADLSALGRAAAVAVRSTDPAQPVFDVFTMSRVLRERTIGLQYVSVIMAVFGGLALLLAIIGVYSLLAFIVTQRTHEIGVRIALGASRGNVLRLAVGEAGRLTAIGVGLGLVLSLALGRLIEAGLFGVVASDARFSIAFAAVLVTAALAAGYLPARRATSIDPIIALRAE